jgi:hypothetical protein
VSISPKSWIRFERGIGLFCLLGVLIWHAQTVTTGWSSPALTGNAFRQLQTGQTTQFIVFEDNYSLAYPTPILGQPWSIPMEFPLYQWMVAKLHQVSAIPLVECARWVSLLSFYSALPAIYLLLIGLGMPARRATLALVPVLLPPVTVLYSRAFLIDTLALSLALWFLYFFTQLLRKPGLRWWLLTGMMGALAGCTKATTLIGGVIACLGVAATAVWQHWRRRDEPGGRDALRTLLVWGATSAIIPVTATWFWTRFADATKALNPIGTALRSDNLLGFNFGHDLFADRFSLSRWQALAQQWEAGIGPWWLVAISPVLVILGAGRYRQPAWLALVVFFGAQLLMPNLFSIHDYYFVGIVSALALAWGLTAAGMFERGKTGVLAALAWLITLAGFQTTTFERNYLEGMLATSGGDDLSHQIYMLTEEDETIIIAGWEWHAFVPYYAKRRALMLPFGTHDNPEIREEALSQLDPDKVAALLLTRQARNHPGILAAVDRHFGLSDQPLLKFAETDVFFTDRVMTELLPTEGTAVGSSATPLQAYADSMTNRVVETASLSRRQERLFANISPTPTRFFFEFGPAVLNSAEGLLINAHTTTELWFDLPAGDHRISIEYGMFDTVWQEDHMVSDGVELQIDLLNSVGDETAIFRHYLDPREREEDRGTHSAEVEMRVPADAEVRIRSHPGRHNQTPFDWFFLKRIEIDPQD